jgi:hypothetical protein
MAGGSPGAWGSLRRTTLESVQALQARLAPNWTSAAGALEGILDGLDQPLPRHAVMGLTGHAFHACLATRGGVVALPGGPSDLDWGAMVERYARTGFAWERCAATLGEARPDTKAAAIAWAISHLDAGRPLIGWDFHLHEWAVVYGYDRARGGFLVDDVLTPEVGPFAPWEAWPSALGQIELFAPGEPAEVDPVEAVGEALQSALDGFAGRDGPADGQPRGTAALEAWAAALEGETEVDRAGNAYMLVVTQAARLDGAAFLADVAAAIPLLAEPLTAAERALRDEAATLAPLITLFPFPSGGHGNVANPGLRRTAAVALRHAAAHERLAAEHIGAALARLSSGGAEEGPAAKGQ